MSLDTMSPQPADLILPGSVITGAGLFLLVVKYALKGYREAQEEFMPRAECVLKHKGELQHLEDSIERRRQSTHDLRNELQKVVLKVESLSMQNARAEERQRWIVAALGSLMAKVGANGVPPPPAE